MVSEQQMQLVLSKRVDQFQTKLDRIEGKARFVLALSVGLITAIIFQCAMVFQDLTITWRNGLSYLACISSILIAISAYFSLKVVYLKGGKKQQEESVEELSVEMMGEELEYSVEYLAKENITLSKDYHQHMNYVEYASYFLTVGVIGIFLINFLLIWSNMII